jgi:UDP-GlcNAc:undecaprenyl-phosphate GlcNAc-1-phosphate transferase
VRTAAVAFLFSMAVAAALTPLVRAFAHSNGLLDAAVGSRKIHGKPIPRLGGIAIVAGFYAPLCAVLFYTTGMGTLLFADRARAVGLLGGGLAIAALGLVDDVRGTGAGLKFAVQFAVALGLYQLGFRIEHIATPLGPAMNLGVLALPFTLLWIVGIVNAMNLIDGLDGLAGGVSMFALSTTFVIAFFRGDAIMALFAATLAGSVLGFLFYNFNPASIFMGDTGSMFLGFILAAGSIWTNQKSSTAVSILVPLVALGLPIADTLLALGRRALRGRPLFSADKEHIHHRLLALGLSQRQAVAVLYGACIVLGAAALVLSWANSAQTAAVLTLLSVVAFFAVQRLGFFRNAPIAIERRKNREVRTSVNAIAAELQRAAGLAEVWDLVKPFASTVGAAGFSLAVASSRSSGERITTLYQVDCPPSGRARFEAGFGIGDDQGRVELVWDDGRAEMDRDHEIALEVLCDHLAAALERLAPAAAEAEPIPANVISLPGRFKQ